MRIISQNGYNFPYEHIVMILDGKTIIARPISDMSGRFWTLGTYKSEERAEDVFRAIYKVFPMELIEMPDE